ncbi:Necrosis inducing protein NPP1 [Phytophthora megakarya]|uniref:Necrosis inducing protein NPP1 n=1 Tax=Phytophthora megakarya TaxID=4795 RepID=A0A225WDT5_9STRA|nr:Necrosis inducing protein NPP1 [Phytophthora megakarya]
MAERNEEPYRKMSPLSPMAFVDTREIWQNRIEISYQDGTYHDLIMWDQPIAEAREALNSADFGEAKVPFNENNFAATLEQPWPF